ncbi:MAG: GumC family protein, partial [Vulcanimicrobiota bacterium]
MNDDINFFEYYEVIKKRKKLFLTIFGVICFIGLVVTIIMNINKTYLAESSFFFPYSQNMGSNIMKSLGGDSDSGVLDVFSGIGGSNMSDYAVSVLKSRTVKDEIIDKFGEQIWKKKFKKMKRTQLRDAVDDVVKIKISKDDIIEIKVVTKNPQLSAQIANEYLEQYQEFAKTSIISFSQRRLDFAEEQKERARQNLQELEKKLKEYQEKKGVLDVDEEAKALINYYSEVKTMAITVTANYEEARNLTDSLRDKLIEQGGKSEENLTYPAFSEDSTLSSYYTELTNKEIEYLNKKENYSAEHPEVINLQKDMNNIKTSIREHIANRLNNIKSKLTPELIDQETKALALRASKEAVESQLADIEKKMAAMPNLAMGYTRLFRDVKVNSEVYMYWEMELQTAISESNRDPTDYQILDEAVPPDHKYRPVLRL